MIEIFKYPVKEKWNLLSKRADASETSIEHTVETILKSVQQNGDKSLIAYTEQFDKVLCDSLEVSATAFEEASMQISEELKTAIAQAHYNITLFHKSQLQEEPVVSPMDGILCWRKSVPIERVGLYIPGGSAPLFSTVLMLAIPAVLAGCKEIIICTPPGSENEIHPAILYTAALCKVNKVYKVGGAQAIAAMAFGTETIPKVNKIFGPGNQYVTLAKSKLSSLGFAIDMPAGPSEVAIVADSTGIPEFIAADILAQAEHGPDSQAMIMSNSLSILERVNDCIQEQIKTHARSNIIVQALKNSRAILLSTVDDCIAFTNHYAPEHLILACENADSRATEIINAGSVFIGHYSPESAGDYATGTNHTLPTNGYAKSYSGVSVDSFCKKITFQKLSKVGLSNIAKAVETMAIAEGLDAHANSITIRLKK
jgi:histidinol dehydrogenase